MKKPTKLWLMTIPVILVLALVPALILLSTQTAGQYTEELVANTYAIWHNEQKGRAFIGEIKWNGIENTSNMTFTVPDQTSGGIKITALGGTRGKDGAGKDIDAPFFVSVPGEAIKYKGTLNWDGNWRYVEESEADEQGYSKSNLTTLRFTVNIGIYVNRIDSALGRRYIGMTVKDDAGNESFVLQYRIIYSFKVADENTFFRGSQYLYDERTDKEVPDFFYRYDD